MSKISSFEVIFAKKGENTGFLEEILLNYAQIY